MTAEAMTLLEDLLRLPAEMRAYIADELYGSLGEDDRADPEVDAAWAGEIERRVADLDAGRAKTTAWAEVDRSLDAVLNRA